MTHDSGVRTSFYGDGKGGRKALVGSSVLGTSESDSELEVLRIRILLDPAPEPEPLPKELELLGSGSLLEWDPPMESALFWVCTSNTISDISPVVTVTVTVTVMTGRPP